MKRFYDFFRRYLVWILVAGVFLGTQVIIFNILGVFRSSLVNEYIWFKNQKRAINEVYHYVLEGDTVHLERYKALNYYLKSTSKLRRELMRDHPNPDTVYALKEVLGNQKHFDQVVLFYAWGRYFKELNMVLGAWLETDRLSMTVLEQSDKIIEMAQKPGSQAGITRLISELVSNDMKISELNSTYSAVLDNQLSKGGRILLLFNIVFTIGLISAGLIINTRIVRRGRIYNESFRFIMQEFPIHLYELDTEFSIVSTETGNGTPRDQVSELDNRNFITLFSPEDRKKVHTELLQAIANKKDGSFAATLRSGPEHRLISVQGFVKALRNEKEALTGLLVLLTDVTRQAEQEAERIQFLQSLDASLNEIYVFDPQTFKLTFVNRGALVGLGYEPDEWQDLTFFDINLDANIDELRTIVENGIPEAPAKFVIESKHLRKDGSVYPVEAHVQYIDFKGNPAFLAVAVDITKRLETEELLRKAFQEQRTLLRETNHRIKNNLNMVASLISIQAAEFEDKKARAMITETVNRLHALMLLHDQLFMAHTMERFVIAEYIDALVKNLVKTFHAVDINFQVTVPAVQLSSFEAIHIGLMVNELVTNAIKHAFVEPGKTDKKVCISLTEEGKDGLLLHVCDNGIGIPPQFDPKTSQSLGLRLLARLARQMEGTIKTNNDGGAHFDISLKTGISTDG